MLRTALLESRSDKGPAAGSPILESSEHEWEVLRLELLGQVGKAKNKAERDEAQRRLEVMGHLRACERERESNEASVRFKEKWGYWRYLPLGVLLWIILEALFG